MLGPARRWLRPEAEARAYGVLEAAAVEAPSGEATAQEADAAVPGPPRRPGPLGLSLVLVLGLALSLPPVDYMLYRGRVHPGVAVAGTELGGMSPGAAEAALRRALDARRKHLVRFALGGRTFEATLSQLGWRPDLRATLRSALAVGRGGRLLGDVADRARGWVGEVRVPVAAAWDLAALTRAVSRWDRAAGRPPTEGTVSVRDGTVVARAPHPGRRVDPAGVLLSAARAAEAPSPEPVPLPLAPVPPRTTPEDVDRAAREARALLAGAVTVRLGPLVLRFTRDQLAELVGTELVPRAGEASVALGFSPSGVDRLLAPYRGLVERPAVDARFVTQGSRVRIVPSVPGRRLDPELAARDLLRVARRLDRAGRVRLAPVPPAFSTEDARALGIVEEVSSFTTYHAPGEPRVTNIHLAADLLDGAIVLPGETFSLNERLGQRTLERGFVFAPAIINGRFSLAVGGGVSQLATTLFNAAFFGGYPFLEYRAHSYYISRYPLGREATLSWGGPDLVFRNDTSTAILIRTEYTDDSITVRIFGDRHGRTVRATDPVIVGRGAYGYTVRVARIVERGGEVVRRETFITFYRYGTH
ncbi:MAG TPA: VanW family protein [Actinomycetota bacterium]|nr:VanW family protein [Actinomycetota bacterium]